MLAAGSLIDITPEKPVAGGRMLARVEGMVVLVAGAIPGERVRARVERADRSLAWAAVAEIQGPHPDRRAVECDSRCGGAAYAHIAYPAQLRLKSQIVADALARIARHPWAEPIAVAASPETGYRMRARLHGRGGLLGFFLEGTHSVCDPGPTRQLLPATVDALRELGAALERLGLGAHAEVDISENIGADMRAVHVTLVGRADPAAAARLPVPPGVTGLSWSPPARAAERVLHGAPWVEERLEAGGAAVRLRRHVRAFFQGNRYLLPSLVARVLECCPDGPVLDLYAGGGLFAVALAAAGRHRVLAVEGDRIAAADLRVNAGRAAEAIEIRAAAVERFVATARPAQPFTLILDPPRSGMSPRAAAGAVRLGAARVLFVSCDVATFARDVRRLLDAGYRLLSIDAFDLFPNTPHVEVLAVLERT